MHSPVSERCIFVRYERDIHTIRFLSHNVHAYPVPIVQVPALLLRGRPLTGKTCAAEGLDVEGPVEVGDWLERICLKI